MRYVIFCLAILVALPTWGASNAERIKLCLEDELSKDEGLVLSSDMMKWKFEFSEYVKENAGVCYEKLTGIPAEFKNGTGLVFSEKERQSAKDAQAESAAEVARAKEALALKTAELEKLRQKQSCLMNKEKAIVRLQVEILDRLEADNLELIEKRTLEACFLLNDNDPNAAILNPICRAAFIQSLHPDLGDKDAFDTLKMLGAKKAEVKSDLITTTNALMEKINADTSPNPKGKSLAEQAFQSCN